LVPADPNELRLEAAKRNRIDLAERGVEVYLTELDVNDCGLRGIAERDAQVESYMRSLVSAALEVPAVTMISNWIFPTNPRGCARRTPAGRPQCRKLGKTVAAPECPPPAAYDERMNPKRARQGLAEALGGGGLSR
jgi:endo-1,4-beta-xylanase